MKLFNAFASFVIVAALALSAQAYEEAAVENGGSITGTVAYQGSVPMRKIITTKDQDVCGGIREEPEIIVDAAKGVKDAVVYLAKVEKGKAWPAAGPKPILDQEKCVFKPRVQVMSAGQLLIRNSDPVLHNTHGWMLGWVYVVENPYYAVTGDDGSFTIGDVPPGDYTLIATHEFTGPLEIPVTVKAGEASPLAVELKKK